MVSLTPVNFDASRRPGEAAFSTDDPARTARPGRARGVPLRSAWDRAARRRKVPRRKVCQRCAESHSEKRTRTVGSSEWPVTTGVANISPYGCPVSRAPAGLPLDVAGKSSSMQVAADSGARPFPPEAVGAPVVHPSVRGAGGSIGVQPLLYTGQRAHVEDRNAEAQLDQVISTT